MEAPLSITASEDQGTAEVILALHNSGYMGPFPVYLGWENYLPFQISVKTLARKSLPNAAPSCVIIIIINIIIIIIIIIITITVIINLIKLLQVQFKSVAILWDYKTTAKLDN